LLLQIETDINLFSSYTGTHRENALSSAPQSGKRFATNYLAVCFNTNISVFHFYGGQLYTSAEKQSRTKSTNHFVNALTNKHAIIPQICNHTLNMQALTICRAHTRRNGTSSKYVLHGLLNAAMFPIVFQTICIFLDKLACKDMVNYMSILFLSFCNNRRLSFSTCLISFSLNTCPS